MPHKKVTKAVKSVSKKKLPSPAGILSKPAKKIAKPIGDKLKKLPGSGEGLMKRAFDEFNPAGPPLKKINEELKKVRGKKRRKK